MSALALGTALSCSTPEDPDLGANALVYVEAYCNDFCAKYAACAPVPEAWGTCDFDICFDDALIDLEEDPCFAEFTEFNRCRFERLSCEEHFETHIMTNPGTACFDQAVALGDCANAHAEDEG